MKKTTLITILVLCSIATAHVAVGESASNKRETWVGEGTLFSPDKRPLCTYDIKLTIDHIAAGTVVRRAFIELPSGETIDNSCKYTGSDADGWSVTCKDNGKPSTARTTLHCFEGGICQEVSVQQGGEISTNTIIERGDNALQLVRTTTKNGQITSVAHDNLNRVSE